MPNYEYECQKCGHHFEAFQKMTDPKLTKCPRCGGKVIRLIGPGAGVVFKGSGFYQTDYRSESYKKAAKAESGGGEKSAAAKPDSPKETPKKEGKGPKPEAKPAPKKKPETD